MIFMSNPSTSRSAADAELEREIRSQRKFSFSEAIGRMAGSGAMKGASPATSKQQAEAVLEECLLKQLTDSEGILRRVLLRQVTEGDLLLGDLEHPLDVLALWVEGVLASDYRLQELVRVADMEWGRAFGERPHFEREGSPPDPDDPYTTESVRRALAQLLERLNARDERH